MCCGQFHGLFMPEPLEPWVMGREPCRSKLCNLIQVPYRFIPFEEIPCHTHSTALPTTIKITITVPQIMTVHNVRSNFLSLFMKPPSAIKPGNLISLVLSVKIFSFQ
jgi:hypothetical protein